MSVHVRRSAANLIGALGDHDLEALELFERRSGRTGWSYSGFRDLLRRNQPKLEPSEEPLSALEEKELVRVVVRKDAAGHFVAIEPSEGEETHLIRAIVSDPDWSSYKPSVGVGTNPGKHVFLIHTRSLPHHRFLVTEITRKLDAVGLTVWQYADWQWTTDEGAVDRDTLRRMLTRTPAVIVLDVEEGLLTPGIQEEAAIFDQDFDAVFPLERFAVVQESPDGYFTRAYPLRLGPSLELSRPVEHSPRLAQRVSLFILRVIIRQSMLEQSLADAPFDRWVALLDDWASTTMTLMNLSLATLSDDTDVEAPRLVEELLQWFCTLSRRDAVRLTSLAPRLCEWIGNGFDGMLVHDRLTERGLETLVRSLALVGEQQRAE